MKKLFVLFRWGCLILPVVFASCGLDFKSTNNVEDLLSGTSGHASANVSMKLEQAKKKGGLSALALTITNKEKETASVILWAAVKDAKDSSGNSIKTRISYKEGGLSMNVNTVDLPRTLSPNASTTALLAPSKGDQVQSCTIVVKLLDQAKNELNKQEVVWKASQGDNDPEARLMPGDLTFEVVNVLAFYDETEGWKTGFKVKIKNTTASTIDVEGIKVTIEASNEPLTQTYTLEGNILPSREAICDLVVGAPELSGPVLDAPNTPILITLQAIHRTNELANIKQDNVSLLAQTPAKGNIELEVSPEAHLIFDEAENEYNLNCNVVAKNLTKDTVDLDDVKIVVQLKSKDTGDIVESMDTIITKQVIGQQSIYDAGPVPFLFGSGTQREIFIDDAFELEAILIDKNKTELDRKTESLKIVEDPQ